MSSRLLPSQQAGTFDLGGELTINRLGFGTMLLPGPGVWGPRAITTKRSGCCVELSSSG